MLMLFITIYFWKRLRKQCNTMLTDGKKYIFQIWWKETFSSPTPKPSEKKLIRETSACAKCWFYGHLYECSKHCMTQQMQAAFEVLSHTKQIPIRFFAWIIKFWFNLPSCKTGIQENPTGVSIMSFFFTEDDECRLPLLEASQLTW